MEDLLYLVHRIPYPPNKGDKIRSYNLLKHLAKSYTVHVGAFIDDRDDWRHAEALAQLAGGELKLLPLKPQWAAAKSAMGFLTGEPLTLPYYYDRRMQAWVDHLLATRPISRALVYSSSMAQYILAREGLRRVIDFVDVDSDKWRQYAEKKSWPMNWVYRREAQTLLKYEKCVTQVFDAAAFVSDAEAALFLSLAPECADKVFGCSNGVDTEYFSPAPSLASPYPDGVHALVFTGAMDYWANEDAVVWFARDIFPAIKRDFASVRFYIVGARPSANVLALAAIDGVVVTGAVPDTRPYIAHAACAVAPLRIARGIQNKVLEAMAMGKAVVASPEAAEGIRAMVGEELLLAADMAAYCVAVRQLLTTDAARRIGAAARQRVVQDYDWDANLCELERRLTQGAGFLAPAELAGAVRTSSVEAGT